MNMKDANLSSQAAEQSVIRLIVDDATSSGKLCLGVTAVGDITIEGVAESPKTGGTYYHYTLTSSEVIIRGDVTSFNCGTYGDNSIVSLDVSHAVNLKELRCYGNKLTSLDLSKNAALTELDCHNNQLTSLDLSHCVNLEGVGCTDNQLTSLDVTACSDLSLLSCSRNKELAMLKLPESPLCRLEVRSCKQLKSLHCTSKTLHELDICGCEALEEVDARDSKLELIWVGDCPNLRVVRFDGTALGSSLARRLVDGLPDRRGSVAGELHLFTAEQEEEAVNILGGLPLDAADKNWNISIVPERLWAALRDIQKDVDTLLGRATE